MPTGDKQYAKNAKVHMDNIKKARAQAEKEAKTKGKGKAKDDD